MMTYLTRMQGYKQLVMTIMKRERLVLLLCLVVLSVAHAGCSLFAGAASMRIEVEVYRGPLSKEPELQWAELMGGVHESTEGMKASKNLILMIAHDQGLIEENATDFTKCDTSGFFGFKHKFFSIIYATNCLILEDLYSDAEELRHELAAVEHNGAQVGPTLMNDKEAVIKSLTEIAKVSSEASAKSFRWSISTIGGASTSFLVRIAMVNFIVASSEMGRQLNARADALLKQIHGLDRQELPLSVQLRETDATEFIRLYDWLGAHPSNYLSGILQPGTSYERVKAVRRLFADHNWSNINTVYASGWGKGSMALIKDDIGNWNLKGFDSDPEDLLKAYKDVSIAALETAMKAVKAGGTGGAGAGLDKLLDVAGQYFTPTPVASTSASGIGQFRQLGERTSSKLRAVESQANSSTAQDAQARDEYQKAVETLDKLDKKDPKYAQQEESVENAKKTLVARRTQLIQDIEKILSEHSELVDLLAKGSVAN